MPKIFEKRSSMQGTAEQMLFFHSTPKAFQTLIPPPVFIQVVRDHRQSITHGEIEFRLWIGFIPLRWLARHEAGVIPTSFVDRMLDGPMAYWEHQHLFYDVPGGVDLIDHIIYEHKTGLVGLFTRLIFDGIVLEVLFFYRHWITKRKMNAMNT